MSLYKSIQRHIFISMLVTLFLSTSGCNISLMPKATDEDKPAATPLPENPDGPIGHEGIPSPMPIISLNVPAYYNTTGDTVKHEANDADYSTLTFISGDYPRSITYDLSQVPDAQRKDILVNIMGSGFQSVDLGANPQVPTYQLATMAEYRLEGNAAPGSTPPPETGWQTLLNVKDNYWESRQHLVINFAGNNWFRLTIVNGDGSTTKINLDIHDAGNGAEDSWLFMGDSITANCFPQKGYSISGSGQMNNFAGLVHEKMPAYFPPYINAGKGYARAGLGATSIAEALKVFPGRYVALNYGTNNLGYSLTQESLELFYSQYETMVKETVAAGKVPVIPKIMYNESEEKVLALEAKLSELKVDYPQIIEGPDLYSFFKDHYDLMDNDNIHPNRVTGEQEYIGLWADAMLKTVYGYSQ